MGTPTEQEHSISSKNNEAINIFCIFKCTEFDLLQIRIHLISIVFDTTNPFRTALAEVGLRACKHEKTHTVGDVGLVVW